MDLTIAVLVGPIYLDNAQLGVFIDPLPSSQSHGYIGHVGISHKLCSFSINNH